MSDSVSINWVKVSPSRVRGAMYDVYWSVSPLASVPGFTPYIMVEASETMTGPWVPLLDDPFRGDCAIGVGKGVFRVSAPPMVRIAISPAATSAPVQYSRPYVPGHEFQGNDFLLYREQLRLEALSLDKFTGFPCFLVQRIRRGSPCPQCTDEIMRGDAAPLDASGDCGLCFGTGVYGGYHRPHRILADWPRRPQGSGTQARTEVGRTEDEKFGPIHLYAFPPVATDDVLVDAGTGNRFLVDAVEPILWKVFTVGHDVSATMLPQGHPAYRIPVAGAVTTGEIGSGP